MAFSKYEALYKNKEVGKLVKFAYYLHERGLTSCIDLPDVIVPHETHHLDCGKHIKDGGMYGMVDYDYHQDEFAVTALVVILGLGKNIDNNKKALYLKTSDDGYNLFLHNLDYISIDEEPFFDFTEKDDTLSTEENYDLFIECMVFLGFQKEDIEKVLEGKMTARDAFQNVAPEEIKNLQRVGYGRKYFIFDGNVAISGDFGNICLDDFPFPFEEQPVLDCSKVEIRGIIFGNNNRRVKLININSKQDSIKHTDLREAVIEEEIDASKVNITGTKFGEHKIINLDKSLSMFFDSDVALADTGRTIELPEKRTQVFSDGSTEGTILKGLNDGSQGISLFRDEFVVCSDQELFDEISQMIQKGWDSVEYWAIYNKISNVIYRNCNEMYSLVGDKDIVFRLTDFNVDNKKRGAAIINEFWPVFSGEVEAILTAAKEHHKVVKILIPYVCDSREFSDIKDHILHTAKHIVGYANVEIGAMIENKKAILDANEIALNADFVSFGTNDLTESILDKKRNQNDADFSILHPEVKKQISKTVDRIRKTKDLPICICGEHANYVNNLEYLLSLNVDGITIHPEFVRGFISAIDKYYEGKEGPGIRKTYETPEN